MLKKIILVATVLFATLALQWSARKHFLVAGPSTGAQLRPVPTTLRLATRKFVGSTGPSGGCSKLTLGLRFSFRVEIEQF